MPNGMIERNHPTLSVGAQCRLLSISRSSFYFEPQGETALNLDLMLLVAEIAEQSAPFKGMMADPAAWVPYDEMIAGTPAADGVASEAATVGGVAGHWMRSASAPGDAAFLYLHGGAYILGSATAYRNFAGQFAARTGIAVFVADYALGPEKPYPAGVSDAGAADQPLQALGFRRIVIVGDSAGGGLSLLVLHWTTADAETGRGTAPVACVVMSPCTDLALTGASVVTKAGADPFVTEAMLRTCAGMYLGQNAPTAPFASPIYGARAGLPDTRIHVGTREVLLDDSTTYAWRVIAGGGRVDFHVWEGMPHVFPSSFAMLDAAETAMGLMADFIQEKLGQ